VPARLSLPAINGKACAAVARLARPAPGRKPGNLRDSSSLVPFAPYCECGLAVLVGKRIAQLLKIGASGPARGAQRDGNENVIGKRSRENKARSSPGGARAIHRF
jgi:hypothetical protein